jgi:hypothetical protein
MNVNHHPNIGHRIGKEQSLHVGVTENTNPLETAAKDTHNRINNQPLYQYYG